MADINRLSQFQHNCMVADIDTNDIWIGTKAELKRYNSATHFWERFDASNTGILLDDEIEDIVIGQKFVCVLTENGVNIFDKDNKTWKLLKIYESEIEGPVHSIVVHDDMLLIGIK
ncbi:hypothetical protein, partial [[Eubacterium] cellulosolvens]